MCFSLNKFIIIIIILSSGVDRHKGRIIFLTYQPPSGSVERSLYLVGKGVTYDTGGADIKAGGVMAGMHRDKCGAAAVAGYFRFLDLAAPPKIQASRNFLFIIFFDGLYFQENFI